MTSAGTVETHAPASHERHGILLFSLFAWTMSNLDQSLFGYAVPGIISDLHIGLEQIGQMLATKWSLATALSFLVWYIFAPQCASTLAVIRRETGSWKWMAVTFFYMLTLAYLASFATYQIAIGLGAG